MVSPDKLAANEYSVASGKPVLLMSSEVAVDHSIARMYTRPSHECARLKRGGRARVTKHKIPEMKMI